MKRFSILALLVVLVLAFVDTAMADNSAAINDSTTGMRISKGPVVIQNASGAGTTLYVATGFAQFNNEKEALAPGAGVSVYAIDTARTNADGTLQRKELTGAALSAMAPYAHGVTLVGAPVVTTKAKAGTSVFYAILAPNAQVVGSVGSGFTQVNTGVTILSLDGTSGAIKWQRGIAINGTVATVATNAPYALVSPLTLDDESVATSGATLYMAVGADEISATGTGATVYSIDADDGSILGQYAFPGVGAAKFASTVTGFFSAPFISGNSLYVLGWDKTSAGVTLYGFWNRNNLYAGVSAVGLVNTANMDLSHAQTPTPCVAGNSIFVVAAGFGTQAGVTVYDKYTLDKQYFRNYGPIAAGSGVSASPVSDGYYIVLCTMSAVTCYPLDTLSNNVPKWTIDLAKSYTDGVYNIFGTPAISNGYVYIPVADTTGANKGFVLRCVLNSTTGNAIKIGTVDQAVAADPIISVGYIYAAGYNPTTIYQIDGGVGAVGYADWKQFKFDKAKTGYSYDPPVRQLPPGDSGGCFISTIQ